MNWKPGKGQLSLSLIMATGSWIWDIYAQAHGIPYKAPEWVIGVILAPYGGRMYAAVRDKLKALENKK